MIKARIVLGMLSAISVSASAATVTITPSKDNTLYQDATGSLSNGAGTGMFVGTTNTGSVRRAVLAFDVAGNVPAGSTITGATLTMRMGQASTTTSVSISLFEALANWGEGTSVAAGGGGGGAAATAGDATWLHTFFPGSFWTSAGGDFGAVSDASTNVSVIGSYAWSSAAMVSRVQAWLDGPAANFGWGVLGGESLSNSAKRFDTRESTTAANRPSLTITYVPAPWAGAGLGMGCVGFAARRRRSA